MIEAVRNSLLGPTAFLMVAVLWNISGCSSPGPSGPTSSVPNNEFPDPVRLAFENASECDLYSLDPWYFLDGAGNAPSHDFHRWEALGKTHLKAQQARCVLEAVDQGRRESDGKSYKCFEPRHGVRVPDGAKTYDLIICYHCGNAIILEGDRMIGGFTTASKPSEFLNQVLIDAKVPLAKTPMHR
jgi:hypothetical protein